MNLKITGKKLLCALLIAFAVLVVAPAATPSTVSAAACSSGGSDSVSRGLNDVGSQGAGTITCPANINSQQGVAGLVAKLINWALYLSGAIAVIFVIYGGYQYILSAGNDESATKGRGTVINALIGLVIIILAYVIVNVVANFITTT